MEKDFYKVFEDKHRGSRELIKKRLRAYIPFLEKLKARDPQLKVLDLGCGRGEWLELMQELAITAHGVDQDAGMLQECTSLQLAFIQQDIFAYLQSTPAESYLVVSCFHVAEHLPFSLLQTLIQESLRILKPGGLLIVETPNPENLVVGTNNFYKDPTHQRPLPPELLEFLPGYYGYEKTKIIRLNEYLNRAEAKEISLMDVFEGSSPDYAVVAQKNGPLEYLAALTPEFDSEYGITLRSLAQKYDFQISQRLKKLENDFPEKVEMQDKLQYILRAERAEAQIVVEKMRFEYAEQTLTQALKNLEDNLQKATTVAERDLANASVKIQTLQGEIQHIYRSKSWRVTRPLRILLQLCARLSRFKFSKLHNKLAQLRKTAEFQAIEQPVPVVNSLHLTSRTQDIYADLTDSIKCRQGDV